MKKEKSLSKDEINEIIEGFMLELIEDEDSWDCVWIGRFTAKLIKILNNIKELLK